ncbi:MAG: XcyI family restriction endonuclease [Thermodesulfobacteriota bacterium]
MAEFSEVAFPVMQPDLQISFYFRFQKIKGGCDASNICNRIGEAEKSHESARDSGFHHLWTIVRAAFNKKTLKSKYPNLRTTHFFNLDSLNDKTSIEYHRFRDLYWSLISIRSH